ncbi:hypothetical protein GCM10023340_08190 [Nocardioides marinquilinus]|uniref:Uncharacterized protein n=1 Tax=Nocardioides marinquilinus TaxID=1210400 RepID=A0ABP9PA51_9ACTN
MMLGGLSFSDLDEADLVRVTDNHDREQARVTDPTRIAAAARWLDERADRFETPRAEPRIMTLRLNFSHAGSALGSVGLGRRYLTAQRWGGFYQCDALPDERAELMELLGVPDPD